MPRVDLAAGRADSSYVAGTAESRQAVDGENLLAGDVVQTAGDPTTIAEIRHDSGAVTRLDAQSEAAVDREWSGARPRTVVTIGPGRTWHQTGPIEEPVLYEVRSPTAVLTARFACFGVVCDVDGATTVSVIEGNVIMRGRHGGSVALDDGQRAVVGADGVLAGVEDADDAAAWSDLAHPPDPPPTEPFTAPAAVDDRGVPRWVAKAGAGAALVVFVAVLALTFANADTAPPPAPATAAKDQATSTTAAMPTTTAPPVAPAPPPAPVAAATLRPTSCRQIGRTIVYQGTLTNTSAVPGSFAVDAVFLTRARTRFGSGTATLTGVRPQQTVTWEVRTAAPGDLRNSGASCETAALRVLP